jgi:glucosamine--fructose-6-phosphate aminotransferase (isomerizing)
MCGIIGYIGKAEALPVLMNGLRRMEYRGYDSAGVACSTTAAPRSSSVPAKIANLAAALEEHNAKRRAHLGIGHTRWATHGEPNESTPTRTRPAHHHRAQRHHRKLRRAQGELTKQHGRQVRPATPTPRSWPTSSPSSAPPGRESFEAAVLAALLQVEGTFGVLVLDDREPDKLVAARRGSPLLLGVAPDATYLASDATAIIGHTDRVVYLEDDEIAVCTPGTYDIIDFEAQAKEHEEQIKARAKPSKKPATTISCSKKSWSSPKTIADTLRGRLDADGTSHLGGLNAHPQGPPQALPASSPSPAAPPSYAGLLGKYLLERLTGLPVDVEVGSEFRYRDPVIAPDPRPPHLAVRRNRRHPGLPARAQRRGVRTLGLVNVVGSQRRPRSRRRQSTCTSAPKSPSPPPRPSPARSSPKSCSVSTSAARDLSLTEGQAIVKALEALPRSKSSMSSTSPSH